MAVAAITPAVVTGAIGIESEQNHTPTSNLPFPPQRFAQNFAYREGQSGTGPGIRHYTK